MQRKPWYSILGKDAMLLSLNKLLLNWNKREIVTQAVAKGIVLGLISQIEPNPTSWQYPLIKYLDLNQHLSASVDTLAENPSLSLLFRHSTNTLSKDKLAIRLISFLFSSFQKPNFTVKCQESRSQFLMWDKSGIHTTWFWKNFDWQCIAYK